MATQKDIFYPKTVAGSLIIQGDPEFYGTRSYYHVYNSPALVPAKPNESRARRHNLFLYDPFSYYRLRLGLPNVIPFTFYDNSNNKTTKIIMVLLIG
jgi:hypothetical protein